MEFLSNLKKSLVKKWKNFFYIDYSFSEWKLQNKPSVEQEVYKIVSLSGGELLDLYDKGGDEEDLKEKENRIKQYFEDQIKPYFLEDEAKSLTQAKYQDWMNQQTKQLHVVEVEDDCTSIASVAKPFDEHLYIWRLDKRGAVGETPLHILFLKNSDKHISIARILLKLCPELAYDLYEAPEYYGESCLHFAIIQNNIEAIKLLLDTKLVDLHARARGKFFLPVNVKRGDIILDKSQYQGYAYYGEYPLSFAASLGDHDIYDLLIESGCDPDKRDRYGNNLLHLCVIHEQANMFYYAINHPKVKANPNLKNDENLTPLALAAKIGKTKMFSQILKFSSHQYWSYNTSTCSGYPLKSFDTIDPDGKTDWNSALMHIIRGEKEGHLDMLSNKVVQHLLTKKWKTFALLMFNKALITFIIHVLFLSVAVYLRPNQPGDLRYGSTSYDYARYCFEVLTVFICLVILALTIKVVFLEGISGFIQDIVSIPALFSYQVGCLLTIICVVLRFTDKTLEEDWLLMIATLTIWSCSLFFFRNFSLTGHFVTIIYRTFSSDVIRFGIIYIIIWITFTLAFFLQFKGQNISDFTTFDNALMILLLQSFGEFNFDNILQARFPGLAIFLFICFMLLAHILLLNMLIAMMTRTFERVEKLSSKLLKKQWASLIIIMEKFHTKIERKTFQESYASKLNAVRMSAEGQASVQLEDTESEDTRAIKVIQTKKSSQFQRKKVIKDKWHKMSCK